jgi:RNA polymerase sigma factor (sigma-70 family)
LSKPLWRTQAPVRFPGVQDVLLVRRLCSGDDSALAEVFDRYAPLVLGLARRVTGNKATADDVLQEVFTALWCHPERFDPERGTLRAYLGVLTHRRSVDAVRASVRRQTREERAESLESLSNLADPADATAIAESVRQAIGRLPEAQRRAIELAFCQGMTQHEVAHALGIPEGTVKSRLRLAQAKLRDWLEPLALETV